MPHAVVRGVQQHGQVDIHDPLFRRLVLPNDRILRWSEGGGVSVFCQPTGLANGRARDQQGRLLGCLPGYRCITRTELDSRVTVLADRFEGKRLNAPNDIVCRSDGTTALTHEIVSVGQSSPPSVPWLMEKFVCCTRLIMRQLIYRGRLQPEASYALALASRASTRCGILDYAKSGRARGHQRCRCALNAVRAAAGHLRPGDAACCRAGHSTRGALCAHADLTPPGYDALLHFICLLHAAARIGVGRVVGRACSE